MEVLPNLVGGQWVTPSGAETVPVMNPSRGEGLAQVPLSSPAEVDAVVQAAQQAFPAWRETPPGERAQVMFRLKGLLEEEFEDLARGISREHGKTLVEARGDLRRGIEMVEFACGAPTLLMGESLENLARGIDCQTARVPLGVVAGICPFNFPAMVPLWMWPLALVCGNCFVLKPSEKVPLTMQRVATLLEKAGLPGGVFSIVHGGQTTVEALLEHPAIAAISFVGSTPVARALYQKACHHGKRVQAAGGAKNFVVILPDADPEKTAEALRDSSFGCAGERCMASSVAVAVGEAGNRVLPALVDLAKGMQIGPTDTEAQPDMGALITAAHRDRVRHLITQGQAQGGALLADGRAARVAEAPEGFYLGPTIVDHVDYQNTLATTEVFGPVLSVMRTPTLAQAIAAANRQAFGNGASIFTSSGKSAREFRHQVSAGMVGVNVGVPAPLSYFPFTGWNESFFGDLHMQGKEGVAFYTKQRTTTTRWFQVGEGDIWVKEGSR
ncbi:MAG: CoA-acylating methylmalonate-semialdehyde dehydrogenase [Verrucomicrobiota bacterium]